jgi:phospholipid/cholesterol/gamma-HCH transport system permease protein
MTDPSVTLETGPDGLNIRFAGRMVTQQLQAIEAHMARISTDPVRVRLDLSEVEALDTGGAWLVTDLQRRLESAGAQVSVIPGAGTRSTILETVAKHQPDHQEPEAPPRGFLPWLAHLGEGTVAACNDSLNILEFLGLTLHRLVRALVMPWRLRPASLFNQMEEAGLKAVPIVALMGFLIGVVLAFQGAVQLKQFGAEIFVVDLIAISILRELGVLLTAIIIAGRSGSAFTASIGSMKVQEEIDAMRALGLDPIDVLVVPRTLALLIVMPILAMIANFAGLIGGALMSWLDLGVSPALFFNRLQENTSVWHLLIGLIKAPFFAFIIGVIACFQAMQVRGSALSLGTRTTASVVQAIFAVILTDALFSILFAELGV